MRSSGALFREIISECGVSRDTVQRTCNEAGLKGAVPYRREYSTSREGTKMPSRPTKPRSKTFSERPKARTEPRSTLIGFKISDSLKKKGIKINVV